MEEERILGVFPIDIGGLYITFYDMYFTNKRIVANFVGHGGHPRTAGKLSTFLLGGGLLEYGVVRPLLAKHEGKEAFLDAEQILRADEKNFAWDYQNDIESIKFKRHGLAGPPVMDVKLASGGKKRCFLKKENAEDLKSLLREVAGDKLVLK